MERAWDDMDRYLMMCKSDFADSAPGPEVDKNGLQELLVLYCYYCCCLEMLLLFLFDWMHV